MGQGLDKSGREYVRDLVERNEKDEYVRAEIRRLVKNRDWDFSKNKDFVDWLRRKGWKVTAEYLRNYITG
jgi:hypothetical protein